MVAAFGRLGLRSRIIQNPAAAKNFDRLVVPGVGSFGPAVRFLRNSGFDELLKNRIRADRPVLGVCLGFHLLCRASEEAPQTCGLGIVEADVRRINAKSGLRVPHMGWSRVNVPVGAEIQGLRDGELFYFAHSYEVIFPGSMDFGCTASYGGNNLVAAFQQGSFIGVQFHPEKSNQSGLRLLESFAS